MTKTDATIRDAAELWLKRCRLNDLERATLRSYKGHFDHHIEPKIGGLLLTDLNVAGVNDFIDDLLENNSKAMARKVLASLRAILSTAQARGMIEMNVAREVRLPRSRRDEDDKIIPTKDEIRALINNAPEKHRTLIITALLTGMRASELRGLPWEHVDFDRRIISVRQRADRYNQIGKPKSRAGRRDIPMAPMVHKVLCDWKIRCPVGSLNLVFSNGKGNVEGHANIYHRIFKPLMIECEITKTDGKPKFGIHALRHAAASLFIEQGWPPKKIQVILGHSSINMTFDVYGHLFHDPEEDVELMAKMESDLLAA
jgi:integrase